MAAIYAQEDIDIETPNGKKSFKKGDVVLQVDKVVDLQQIVSLATTAKIGDTKPDSKAEKTEAVAPVAETESQAVTVADRRPRTPK